MEKSAYKLLTASEVKLKTYIGEVLDVLGEMQCSRVCKGKLYYLPILVGDYGVNGVEVLTFSGFYMQLLK